MNLFDELLKFGSVEAGTEKRIGPDLLFQVFGGDVGGLAGARQGAGNYFGSDFKARKQPANRGRLSSFPLRSVVCRRRTCSSQASRPARDGGNKFSFEKLSQFDGARGSRKRVFIVTSAASTVVTPAEKRQ